MNMYRLIVLLILLPADSIAADLLPSGFDQRLVAGPIQCRVQSSNDSSINQLTLTPAGLEVINRPEVQQVDGIVTGAEIADLDADGYPEIYVYISSAGSGSYGSLVAYAVNNGKSMSPIYLPPLAEDPELVEGYMGHDKFVIADKTLLRRFPLYRAGDTNASPSGGTRQIRYQLVRGEASWILRPEMVVK